jgi:hypothetical protein
MTMGRSLRSRLAATIAVVAALALAELGSATRAVAFHTPRQGFGAETTGGAGGAVVRVTNLNDAGPGSLREALRGGNRTVVFDVAGEIPLAGYLYVQGSQVTIDGASAPAPGITLRGHGLAIHGTHTDFFSCGNDCHGVHDVIVRHLRVRGSIRDGIRIAHNARRIVLDHVSVQGSADGNLDISESEDVTVQWSIFAEPAGDQKNSLIKYAPRRITLHHNLFTHARQRNPQIRVDDVGTPATQTTVDMRNNVVFDWLAGHGTLVWYGPWANVAANYYASPASAGGVQGQAIQVNHGGRAWVSGNVAGDAAAGDVNDVGTETTPFPAPPVTTSSACTAAAGVLQSAGVRPLDDVDVHYVAAVTLAGCGGAASPPSAPPPVPLADLTISGLTAPGSAGGGAPLSVGVTTRNGGSGPAAASTTRLYLSTDAAVSADDVVLGDAPVPALAPGEAATRTIAATIPAGAPAGSYRLLARADAAGAVGETSETNNTTALALSILGALSGGGDRCDLAIQAVTAPRTARRGTTVTGGATVLSRGPGAAPATTLQFYLSPRRDSLVGAVPLGTVPVPALPASTSVTVTRPLTVPAATAAGRYYLIAAADTTGTAAETTEKNNLGAWAIVIE